MPIVLRQISVFSHASVESSCHTRKQLSRTRYVWEDNIKMFIREIGTYSLDWTGTV